MEQYLRLDIVLSGSYLIRIVSHCFGQLLVTLAVLICSFCMTIYLQPVVQIAASKYPHSPSLLNTCKHKIPGNNVLRTLYYSLFFVKILIRPLKESENDRSAFRWFALMLGVQIAAETLSIVKNFNTVNVSFLCLIRKCSWLTFLFYNFNEVSSR